MTSDLERRVRDLEDERAIARLMFQLSHALDRGDEATWVGCWDQTGTMTVRYPWATEIKVVSGTAELGDFIRGRAHPPDRWQKHVTANPIVTLDGDEARVESYFVLFEASAEGANTRRYGTYRDRLSRSVDGTWRLVLRDIDVEGPPPSTGGAQR